MKESLWGYWIIILGLSIIGLMMFLQSYTTTSEQDYYLIKSSLEASMLEAIDYGYLKNTGSFKMNREKFVENFLRRFSETVNINKTYQVDFYKIYETPPAATVAVTTKSESTSFGKSQGAKSDQVDITTRMSGIIFTTENYKSLKKK